MALVRREWHGDELIVRTRRASGRAVVGIGMLVAADTKRLTHRISGTLARSVHAAEAGRENGEEDLELAESGADLMVTKGIPHPTPIPGGMAVEVGSWLPYACVEWIGRGHPGITEGLEGVRGARADAIVRAAFEQEGL